MQSDSFVIVPGAEKDPRVRVLVLGLNLLRGVRSENILWFGSALILGYYKGV